MDSASELPLAYTVAPANENSQYSSQRLRRKISSRGVKPVIPYPANQRPKEAEFLRVDKRFRTHGPSRLKNLYRHRASVERTISRLKQHLNLENHKAKGLRNLAIHVLLCIIAMLLTALTAIKHGKPQQIRAKKG